MENKSKNKQVVLMRRFNDCIFPTKVRHNCNINFLDLNFFYNEIPQALHAKNEEV